MTTMTNGLWLITAVAALLPIAIWGTVRSARRPVPVRVERGRSRRGR
jgi:hypothetical protein